MNNRKKYSRVMSIAIAVAMLFSVMVFMPEDVSAATKKPGKVKITKAVKLNRMITVTWKKTKKAKKYQIYLKEGKKKWKKVATVKANGKAKQSYKIKKLKWNTKYIVKMRAINGKKKGKWSGLWGGRLGKKTTLQALVKKNKSLKKEVDRLQNDLNEEEGISANVGVVGNTIKIVEAFVGTDCTDYLSDARSSMKREFVNAKMKKTVKKDITRIENNTGIFGVKFRVIIYDGVGNELLDYTYK